MRDPVFFHAIHLDMPVEAVYRRLGYRKAHTQLGPGQRRDMETVLEDAAGMIELKGSALILKADVGRGSEVTLETGDVLRSRGLARMLSTSRKVLLMGATAGNRIMGEISSCSAGGNLARAVVLDAAASEMTDSALDWISACIGQQVRREGLEVTPRRFSAGYGDFDLTNQKIMYERLRLGEIDVSITDACILLPEKSVTAIAGIRKAERKDGGKCQ
ncbi:MAG: methionine synthase [Desulfomonilia bacterium]|nr:methionine synthase [Deltaproteobacteria bacterium]MDX9760593.1 methionine synthase [Desulfomonilia bacterium]HPW68811.1 methionine synthase [Deltaproteobacteria bacterium]